MKKYDLKAEGPGLTSLTHRLSECPEEFLMDPHIKNIDNQKKEVLVRWPEGPSGKVFAELFPKSDSPKGRRRQKVNIHTTALVSDLLEALGGEPLTPADLAAFPLADSRENTNLLRLIQVCCHLFYDSWFRERGGFARRLLPFLTSGLKEVARVVDAGLFVTDPERREELARLCLAGLGLRPAGESEIQALDRLTTVDSVERKRILAETRKAQKRAEELRKAMARKAAQEAASKMTRE